jgi:X-X-X-Leu-X-X-Gly heptad repeat protein
MIRPVGTGADVTKPEYQHFIPQFSLRNFSHKYEGGTKKAENLYNKTKVVNVMNLSEDGPRFIVKAVKRTFGHFDMYCDKFALTPTQKRHVESELGKLESGISKLESGISKLESGISSIFFERYNHTSLRDYTAKDKHKLFPYMYKCSLQRPVDVWLDNLMKILTTPFTSTDDYVNKL